MSLVILGALATAAPMARANGVPFPSELVWGNDQVYRILGTKIPVPGAPAAQESFYIIGSVDPTQPQATYGNQGVYDHTIPVPPGNKGSFSAIWHILWLVAGPNATPANVGVRDEPIPFGPGAGTSEAFVYAADLTGTGNLVALTSLAKVQAAISKGRAMTIDSTITFTCPVVPANTNP